MSSSTSKKTMSSKPSTIEELSEDLVFEILHRLPLPSLLQCKSVNKLFQSVISGPRYLHSRLTHHQLSARAFETHTLFFLYHFHLSSNYVDKMLFSIDSNNKTHILKGSNFLPRSWPQDRDRVRVKVTHYDLVLCSTQSHCYIHYFVCNPFTKQCVVLPPLHKSQELEWSRVGFMCDHSRSRFRVVHIPIVCFQMVESFQVNMFSSETGEWGASNVTFPREILMSNMCFRNILVYDEKFVWWIKDHGFLVCDPFNGRDSTWRLMDMHIPCDYFDAREYDIYNGICNGRVMILEVSRTSSQYRVHELMNFEEGEWSSRYNYDRVDRINNMNLLAFHPHCEHMIYFHSKKGIFLWDYKNRTLKAVYTAVDEDLRAWGNVMSLVLPECPTPVPTWDAAKI